MEFIILYHTLFTLRMSRRGILYAYDYNTEIEKFLIDNTKEVKNINTAANTVLLNKVRLEVPQFNNLMIEYKEDSQDTINTIVENKEKYLVAKISNNNLFNSKDAADVYFATNQYSASETVMNSIKTLENSINKYADAYNNYYNSYSSLFDEMKQQADISKAKDRINEISGKIDKIEKDISFLQSYKSPINSINTYVNTICSGIATDYHALINAFEEISNVYREINNNPTISTNDSLSLNKFYQALYSYQIIEDAVLDSALSDLNKIIVAYINNTDLNTTNAQMINKLSVCISYLEELKNIRQTNQKIEKFEDTQLKKTYILVYPSSVNNTSESLSKSKNTKNEDDYNYNRISEEEWNEERHKDIADFIDITKSLPNIELLLQYSSESSSDSNIKYLKSINDTNYISNILKQAYDYNREKLEKISDIERAWNYFYSEKNLLAWFCVIISIFLDISSMLIGFFLYTSQKKSQ